MRHNLQTPITYLITSGATTAATTPSTEDFPRILKLVAAAVAAEVSLIQLREKNLTGRTLYELALQAAALTRGSTTRLLVNDRADIGHAAGGDGVHLTSHSLEASIIRRTFGEEFLIGVSSHSLDEARAAREGDADFAVFGPVFETTSKRNYGEPVGLKKLTEVASTLSPFPIIALGGVTAGNALDCIDSGARGIAGISLFNDPCRLRSIVNLLRDESS